MTKLQTWNAAMAILNDTTFKSNEMRDSAIKKFEALLAPKKAGGTKKEALNIDGVLYYHCRYTNLYFPSSEMIYQNEEHRTNLKDKGYSNIGISLWNKGQKYLKELQIKSVEIAYGDDQSDEAREEGMKLHKEFTKLKFDNSMNNYEYLMEHFLSNEQADVLESLDLPSI